MNSPPMDRRLRVMAVSMERRRWGNQSRAGVPGRADPHADAVMATLAAILGSRSPAAARQALRRSEAILQAFAVACHRHNSGHRLLRYHTMTMPVPPVDDLSDDDWRRVGMRDRAEDEAREAVLLSDEDSDALRRYEATVRKLIAEYLGIVHRIARRLAGAA